MGDVLIGQVVQKSFHGLVIRVIATDNGTRLRDISDLSIKGSIHADELVAAYDRKDGSYSSGDLVRCEVTELSADKLSCGMKGVHQTGESQTRKPILFGLVSKEQLPKSYRYQHTETIIEWNLKFVLAAEWLLNLLVSHMKNAWRATGPF